MTVAEDMPWAVAWHQHLVNIAAGKALLAVLDLHAPQDTYPDSDYPGRRRAFVECDGCDGDGPGREAPQWPCETIKTIASALGQPMYQPCPQHPDDAGPPRVWPDGTHDRHTNYRVRPPVPCPVGGRPDPPHTREGATGDAHPAAPERR